MCINLDICWVSQLSTSFLTFTDFFFFPPPCKMLWLRKQFRYTKPSGGGGSLSARLKGVARAEGAAAAINSGELQLPVAPAPCHFPPR